MNNMDVYYGKDNIPPKFKYSYMNEYGQWVHLCDCGTSGELTSVGNFDKSNGFTNCNCANSQYINVTYPIESDTYQCRIIDSECWKKGVIIGILQRWTHLEKHLNMTGSEEKDPNTNQCKKNGQIIDSQLVPGAFWNIMDPFCSFLNIDPLSDETNIFKEEANMKRCCIGCNHKVYSGGGISSSSNIYSSDTGAPSYASNWPNTIQQGTTAS